MPVDQATAKMDFHTALSSLGQFPGMMLGLGIVINLEIPYDNKLRLGRRLRVVPTTRRRHPGRSASPWTAYDLTAGRAHVARAIVSAKGFATRPKSSDLKSGYMVMRTPATPVEEPRDGRDGRRGLRRPRAQGDGGVGGEADQGGAEGQAGLGGVGESSGLLRRERRRDASRSRVPSRRRRRTSRWAFPGSGHRRSASRETAPARSSSRWSPGSATKEAYLEANQDKLILNYAEDVVARVPHRRVGQRDEEVAQALRPHRHVPDRRDSDPLPERRGHHLRRGRRPPRSQDEGWIETAAVSDPNKTDGNEIPDEIWVHEHMFDWTGWSLAVPRPGAALAVHPDGSSSMIRESVGAGRRSRTPIGGWVDPDFPLATEFSVPDGSSAEEALRRHVPLPRAQRRSGRSQRRLRGRFADGRSRRNRRHEPDRERQGREPAHRPGQGTRRRHHRADEARRVAGDPRRAQQLRHARPTDIPPTSRHITPPRSSVEMAEELGGLDDALQPGKPVDPDALLDARRARRLRVRDPRPRRKATSSRTARRRWPSARACRRWPSRPTCRLCSPASSGPSPSTCPRSTCSRRPSRDDREGRRHAAVPARHALARRNDEGPARHAGDGLRRPHVSAAAVSPPLGSIAKVGVVKIPLTATTSETVKTIMVDFDQAGQKWYNKRSFKLVIKGIEATDTRLTPHATPEAPKWNSTARTLTVELPKADKVSVELSLVHQPGRPQPLRGLRVGHPAVRAQDDSRAARRAQADGAADRGQSLPTLIKATMAPNLKALVGVSILGRNWTITPHDTLTLVHAVQQPLIEPKFTAYARVNRARATRSACSSTGCPSTARARPSSTSRRNGTRTSTILRPECPSGTTRTAPTRPSHAQEKVFNVTVGPATRPCSTWDSSS